MPSLASAALLALAAALGASAAGPRPECYETYNVKPTDTCASIAAWSLIPVSTIASLNPAAKCATPGLGVKSVCLGSLTLPCTLNATAYEASCAGLAKEYSLSTAQFYALNSNVDAKCDNLVPGEPYCVSTAECYPGNHVPYC